MCENLRQPAAGGCVTYLLQHLPTDPHYVVIIHLTLVLLDVVYGRPEVVLQHTHHSSLIFMSTHQYS